MAQNPYRTKDLNNTFWAKPWDEGYEAGRAAVMKAETVVIDNPYKRAAAAWDKGFTAGKDEAVEQLR